LILNNSSHDFKVNLIYVFTHVTDTKAVPCCFLLVTVTAFITGKGLSKYNRKCCNCNFVKVSIGGRQINARTSS